MRLATLSAMPTREELDESQCADAAELLHTLRDGAPDVYAEHVQQRTLTWDDGPKQRTFVLVRHLLALVLHNVEAGVKAHAAAEKRANSLAFGGARRGSMTKSSKGLVTSTEAYKLTHAPLTEKDVDTFSRYRAEGGALVHGRLKNDHEMVVSQMRKVESKIMEALRGVPAFDVLDDAELGRVRKAFSIAKFEDGERIFNQGDEGDKFFLITTGHCEVLRFESNVGEIGGEICVGRLHVADCFGERALLYGEPRAATIRAGPGCMLYVVFITRDDFERTMGKPLTEFQKLRKIVGAVDKSAA